MKRSLFAVMLAVMGCAAALPALADDMNPTDTRAEFTARAAHRYHVKKAEHRRHHHRMVKKAMKPVKKPAKPAHKGWFN